MFVQRFSSTPLGARLARRLAVNELDAWGIAHDDQVSEAAASIVAELAANAVTHGRVAGRDFELRLRLTASALRIEVSDRRGERWLPLPGNLLPPSIFDESGRGLLLVESLADRWSVEDRDPRGKTVRAEIDRVG